MNRKIIIIALVFFLFGLASSSWLFSSIFLVLLWGFVNLAQLLIKSNDKLDSQDTLEMLEESERQLNDSGSSSYTSSDGGGGAGGGGE